MLIANTFIHHKDAAHLDLKQIPSVTLTLEQRRRSRQLLTLDNSTEQVGMAIDRGQTLRHGDVLVTQDEHHILVQAALENVVRVTADSPWQLARAAYHLGNRHVLLEIAEGHLQFEYDAVLIEMLEQIGDINATPINAIFEPDVGAYGGGHRHGHDESFEEDYALAQAAYHTHEPGHSHDHDHDHAHHHHHHHHDEPGKQQ